jgi:hypothetical protein
VAGAGTGKVGYLAFDPEHGQLSFKQVTHTSIKLAYTKNLAF